MSYLFSILEREFSYADVVDFTIVVLLLMQLYRLVRGTIVFNIFLGILLVYIVYLAATFTKLQLLHDFMGQFINVGVIALLIVFQPEIRKFLLVIGKVGFLEQFRFFKKKKGESGIHTLANEQQIRELCKVILGFSKNKTGALIIFSNTLKLHDLPNTGVEIQGIVSGKLLESIFQRSSPLHDGAVIVAKNKIIYAGTVLPVSESKTIPEDAGLRHRAAVGITEVSDATAIVVSEETGNISIASEGKLETDVQESKLLETLHHLYE